MTCTHDLAEKETAVGWDGLCPICLQAENARLREENEGLSANVSKYLKLYEEGLRELDGLREENKQLRRAYESDAEAIEQAAENASLRAELGRVREERQRLRDQVAELYHSEGDANRAAEQATERGVKAEDQRDTLLAALRGGTFSLGYDEQQHDYVLHYHASYEEAEAIKTAISEVEGEHITDGSQECWCGPRHEWIEGEK